MLTQRTAEKSLKGRAQSPLAAPRGGGAEFSREELDDVDEAEHDR